MSFNLGLINEAIADAVGDREAMVTRHHRFTWRDVQLRSRKLARLLHDAGLGCHRERAELQPWESGQDHLALYLYNGHEYMEGMLGAYKARVAPFNVNYRYVAEELLYVLRDAGTKAIVYHATFAPLLREVLPKLTAPKLLLQVDDGSGEALLPGAQDYETALAGASDAPLADVDPSPDDLYILYTGGTTGMPKGVLWRQEDIFFAALGGKIMGGPEVGSVAELVERCKAGAELRMLPAPPFMHGAAHWAGFIMWHSGGTICLQENTRTLDAHDVWSTVEREKVVSLSIVGDAFARPLLDQLAKGTYDLSSLKILGSGGAILSAPLKSALLEALPGLIIFDGFGSSETGAQGSTMSMKGMEGDQGSFKMDDNTCVLDEALTRRLAPGEDAIGWLARLGRMPLGYLGDEAKTKKTYPVVGGVRYAVPGDRAQVAADGQIRVFGRDSVCINSGGEKIFAEEVEQALKHHPAVYDVIVTGTPNERWGEQVTALVQLRPGATAAEEELRETAATQIARYKLPKAFVFVDALGVPRAASPTTAGRRRPRRKRSAAESETGRRASYSKSPRPPPAAWEICMTHFRSRIAFLLAVGVGAGWLAAGAGADVPAPAAPQPPAAGSATAKATFAGGCFWCMEPPYDALDGVVSTTSGYIGGQKKDPTYDEVSAGTTGHAEAVEIVYDPSKVSYEKLLDVFWHNIDPVTANRQFCDRGTQYRSAIFYHDAEQKKLAESSKQALETSGKLGKPIVTEIVAATTFYPAEDYHQDYYEKNPVRYKYYRYSCGRDARLKELWGDAAGH